MTSVAPRRGPTPLTRLFWLQFLLTCMSLREYVAPRLGIIQPALSIAGAARLFG